MRASQIRLLTPIVTAVALWCGPAAAHERPVTTPAARFVQDILDRTLVLVRPPVSAESGADLAMLIRSTIDWPALTQFAVGRYVADLSPEDMNGATDKLEGQMEALARRAGADLPTMTVAIHDMRVDPDGARRVLSTATVPRFGEVEVEWTLVPTPTGYLIADIKALGMTLRQFLRSWIAGLVAAEGGNAAAVFDHRDVASP
jgi:hypothetical protein